MSECEELRKDLEIVNNSWQKEIERVKKLECALNEEIDQIQHMIDERDFSEPSAYITLNRIKKALFKSQSL